MDSFATLHYLLNDAGDGTRFDSYVFDGLIAERELLKTVREKVAERDGELLFIEHRITRSIEDTLRAAGVTETDIPSRKTNGWPSVESRLTDFAVELYVTYRTSSGAVHGTFTDLEKHYLIEKENGRFDLIQSPYPFRPQSLTSLARLMLIVVAEYARRHQPTFVAQFGDQHGATHEHLVRLDELHETFLESRRSK